MPTRVLGNIINSWLEYTAELPASEFLRKWGVIGGISCALTRRVWIKTKSHFPPLPPNFFLLLLGDPGVGKDVAIEPVRNVLLDASKRFRYDHQGVCIGPKSISAKGLLDALNSDKAELELTYGLNGSAVVEKFHSLAIISPELGVLFPEYNTSLASIMCDLWNCGPNFEEKIRNNKGEPVFIERPHLCALLGTQPSFLGANFPEEAYSMGFFARTIILFEADVIIQDLFDMDREEIIRENERKYSKQLNHLINDFQALMELSGPFTTDRDARHLLNDFHKNEAHKSKLHHSRFEHYNTRRSLHLVKLAMIMSAAESSSLIITAPHVERAKETMFEAEKRMPHGFRNLVTSSGFSATVEEITHGREGRVLSHQVLEATLRRKHRPGEIGQIIQSMLSSGALVVLDNEQVRKTGIPQYQIMKEELLRD